MPFQSWLSNDLREMSSQRKVHNEVQIQQKIANRSGIPSNVSRKFVQDAEESPEISRTATATLIGEEEERFPRLSTWQAIVIPSLATLASVMQASSSIGISLSIRPISSDLGIPVNELQWVQTSAALSFACTLLLFGRLADIWGHKFFFVTGLLLSAIFSLACGFAHTKMELIIFRAITGISFAWCVLSSE